MSLINRLAFAAALLCAIPMAVADEPETRAQQLEREYKEEQAVLNKRQQESFQEDAREESAQKRKCGKDYMTLRIGMKIQRVEECLGAVYVTETTSKSGVTETYRTTFDLVQVKDGRVVSYTRRTDN